MSSVLNFATGGLPADLLNNAEIDGIVYKYGNGSLRLNASTNAYLKSGETFTLGTTDWCLEFWVNLDANQTNATTRLFQFSKDLPNEFSDGHIHLRASGGLSLLVFDHNQATPLISTTVDLYGQGWKHIAVNRFFNTWKLFVDGVIEGTGTYSGAVVGTNPLLIGGCGYTSTAVDGWIDDIRFTFGSPRYVESFTPPTSQAASFAGNSSDSFYTSTSLLLHFNGTLGSSTITDNSAAPLTPVGNTGVTLSTTQIKFGATSGFFPGNARILYNNSALALGAGEFTVEAWIFPTGYNTLGGIIAQAIDNGTSLIGYGVSIGVNSSGVVAVISAHNTSAWASPSVPISLNQWTHVAVARNSANLVTLYVNGIGYGSSATGVTLAEPKMLIGQWHVDNPDRPGYHFIGYIDDVRITKGACRYTANFNVPSTEFWDNTKSVTDSNFSNVALLLHMDGANLSTAFIDSSLNELAVTASGAILSSNQVKFGTTSAFFDGNDFLTVPYNDAFQFNTGDFTIEAWIYLPGNQSGAYAAITDIRNTASGSGAVLFALNSSNQLVYYTDGNFTSTGSVPLNQWAHVALVRASGITKAYINGVVAGGPWADSASKNQTPTLYIGRVYDNAHAGFNGYIDDLRITRGVARYTADFIVPEIPFWDSSQSVAEEYFDNVSLLMHFDGTNGSVSFADSSNNNFIFTSQGAPVLSTVAKRFGTASLLLDGNDDYLTRANNSAFDFGTGDFTVEAWLNFNGTGDAGLLASGSGGFDFSFIGSEIRLGRINTAWDASVPFARSINTWYHVAWCRAGSVLRIFVNGVQIGADISNAIAYNSATSVTIGTAIGQRVFNGYIDELRVTKGIARYTAAFQPAAGPFPNGNSLIGDDFFESVKLLYRVNNYLAPLGRAPSSRIAMSTFAPDWPLKTKIRQENYNVNRGQFGGKGKIYGTVKIKGAPNVPVSRRVRLFTEREGFFLAETWSDAATGNYEFLGFDPNVKYTVLAYDYQQSFRAVIADNLTPEIYEP